MAALGIRWPSKGYSEKADAQNLDLGGLGEILGVRLTGQVLKLVNVDYGNFSSVSLTHWSRGAKQCQGVVNRGTTISSSAQPIVAEISNFYMKSLNF